MEQIISIEAETLRYTDGAGQERQIDLPRSRDLRWAVSHAGGGLISRLLGRRRCRIAADHFWGIEEAYFKFYTPEEPIMFAVRIERTSGDGLGCDGELPNALEARRRFDMLRDMLARVGWTTQDDWLPYDGRS